MVQLSLLPQHVPLEHVFAQQQEGDGREGGDQCQHKRSNQNGARLDRRAKQPGVHLQAIGMVADFDATQIAAVVVRLHTRNV